MLVDLVTLGADHAPLKRYGALLFLPLAEAPPTFQVLFTFVPCFWNNFSLGA